MNRLTLYDPFADQGFDDLFRGFFRPVRGGQQPSAVAIKMDVTENENAYVVHAEIPGVKKEDVQVTIEGNQVTIAAEVKREVEHKDGQNALRNERYFGSVYRSFTLPVEVDESQSAAKCENGILELTLVKKATQTGKKLTIQ